MPPARKGGPGSRGGGAGRGSGGSRGRGGDGDGGRGDRYEETAEAVELHQAWLQYRLAGGVTPTTQLYLQSLEAFRRLPGAVRARPPFVPPPPSERGPSGGDTP
jgi:hypothetical protein